MPTVTLDILVWARETAGLSLAQAAARLGIGEARGISPADRLSLLEGGEAFPSRALLVKMAKVYRRPLLTFYMRDPPMRGERGADFRSLPERTTDEEPLVDALIRDIRTRQSMVRAVMLDDAEPPFPLPFVSEMQMSDGVGAVLASMARALGFDLAEYRAQGSADAAFNLLRTKVEHLGVFVLLIGDLGSYQSAISVDAFRGFALADSISPFIVINDQDSKSAWAFTLLHELAHLWIGETGVSGRYGENKLERFCSDVASNLLLPEQDLADLAVNVAPDDRYIAKAISDFANERLISRSLVAYRLFLNQALPEASWRRLAQQFQTEWQESRMARRERNRGRKGPSYYIVRRHRLGAALLRFVAGSMSDGALTPTKAGKILGVKARSVHPLLAGGALTVTQGE